MMELRHLEHFIAVAEERNFTRAARRLHLVQSALSVSIRSLERELGIRLFERTTREVEPPTPAMSCCRKRAGPSRRPPAPRRRSSARRRACAGRCGSA